MNAHTNDREALIVLHSESRRDKIIAATQMMSELSTEDRAMVLRWIRRGDGVNELELGQMIADYRAALGRAMSNPVEREPGAAGSIMIPNC